VRDSEARVSFSSSSGMIISGASRHRLHQTESIKTKLRSKNRLEPHSFRPRIRIHGSSVADLGCLSRSPDPNFFHPGFRICIITINILLVKGFFMEIKKVEISMKNSETYQIMRFSSIKS
jgi:hypothetical protein